MAKKYVGFFLSATMKKDLKILAEADGRTISGYLTKLLTEHVKENK